MQGMMEPLETRRMLAFGDLDLSLRDVGWTPLSDLATPTQVLARDDGSFYVYSKEKIVRYRANGTLDPTFGKRGRAYSNFSRETWYAAADLTELPDGTLQSTGSYYRDGTSHRWAQRVLPDGTPDLRFGTDGAKEIGEIEPLTPGTDGNFYTFMPIHQYNFNGVRGAERMRIEIRRYNGQLEPDSTWGTNGIKSIILPTPTGAVGRSFDFIGGITVREDGSFLLHMREAWQFLDPRKGRVQAEARVTLVQLTPQGDIDRSALDSGFYSVRITSLQQYPAERIFVAPAGRSVHLLVVEQNQYALARVTDGVGPTQLVIDRPSSRYVDGMSALPDGRVIFHSNSSVAPMVEEDGRAAIGDFVDLQPPRYGGRLRGSDGIDEDTENTMNVAHAIVRDGVILGIGRGIMSRVLTGTGDEPRSSDIPGARESAIATDNAGRTHLVYRDTTTNTLLYKQRDETGRWQKPEFVDAGEETGVYLSLVIDTRGRPVVAYYHGPTASLRLATRVNGKWRAQTIDDAGSVGQFVNLDIGNDGLFRLAYHSRSGGDLKAASQREDGSWYVQTLDSTGNTGLNVSMYVDDISQRMVIAYSDDANRVRLATQEKGGRWIFRTVAQTTAGTDGVAVGYDGYAKPNYPYTFQYTPTVAYHDQASQDLVLARLDPERNTFTSLPVITRGNDGHTPVRDMGTYPTRFWHIDRSTNRPVVTMPGYRLRDASNSSARYAVTTGPFSIGAVLYRGDTTAAFAVGDELRVRDI